MTGVVATLTSDSLDADEEESVGTIRPGDEYRTTFDVDASAEGTVTVEATVESENAGSVSETATFTVRTKRSIVETVLDTLETSNERVRSSGASKRTKRRVTAKIDAAIRSMNRALDEIERGRNKQANNALRTGVNQLGALLNSLDAAGTSDGKKGGNGKVMSPERRTALVNRTELSIDHLVDARETPIRH